MKLKGKNSKRIKKEKKEKMKKTLKRMEETREEDSRNLRDVLKIKLDWAKAEKEKGLKYITKIKSEIKRLEGRVLETQIIIYRLEGVISGFGEILETNKENDSR